VETKKPSATEFLASVPLERLRAFTAQTEAALREGHRLAVGSQDHTDNLLTWLIAILTGGIFSVQGVLGHAPIAMRLYIFIPWTLGVLLGVLCKFLGGELRNKMGKLYFRRIAMLGLLLIEEDRALILSNLRPIIENAVLDADPEAKSLTRMTKCANAIYYSVYVWWLIGVIVAVAVMAITGDPRQLGGV
jgi:hypothetical protein